MITRRDFLRSAAAGAATLVVPSALPFGAGKATAPNPNIIVILADDLGWGDLSCYPQDPNIPDARLRTPNIDSLAAEGARFTQGYATCTVCTPSRAGLLTGRYQQRMGWYEFIEARVGLPKGEVTLADCLKRAGVRHGVHRQMAPRRHSEPWPAAPRVRPLLWVPRWAA